ncbi:MAG: hypothetical protein WDA26_02790 [Pusillimonas sp.]
MANVTMAEAPQATARLRLAPSGLPVPQRFSPYMPVNAEPVQLT